MQDSVQSEDRLLSRKDGGVGHVIFNNPAKHNAVSLDMWRALQAQLEEFAADSEIRVLVLSGAGGKAFVSGADISKFESERATKEAVAEYNKTALAANDRLYHFPKPTIAKIAGYCIGGGVNIAACCDLRYCTESSRFAIPAAKLGLGYGYTGLKRLSDIVGMPHAVEMFYTARQFAAPEAYDMGLVNAVVADGDLDTHIEELTGRIAVNAPLTIAAIKAASREISKDAGARDLDRIETMVQACFDSEDYIEGRRAFMEKRTPAFKGR